jgi:hypothetical protein
MAARGGTAARAVRGGGDGGGACGGEQADGFRSTLRTDGDWDLACEPGQMRDSLLGIY